MTTSKGKHFHFAGIQVVSRRDNLEFPGLHPFGEDWFSFPQLLGNVERLGAHCIVDWIAWLAFGPFDGGLDGFQHGSNVPRLFALATAAETAPQRS
jgi:hypothetical protein